MDTIGISSNLPSCTKRSDRNKIYPPDAIYRFYYNIMIQIFPEGKQFRPIVGKISKKKEGSKLPLLEPAVTRTAKLELKFMSNAFPQRAILGKGMTVMPSSWPFLSLDNSFLFRMQTGHLSGLERGLFRMVHFSSLTIPVLCRNL